MSASCWRGPAGVGRIFLDQALDYAAARAGHTVRLSHADDFFKARDQSESVPVGICRLQSCPRRVHLLLDGAARPFDHPLAGVDGDTLTHQPGRGRPRPRLRRLEPQGDQRCPGLVQRDGAHPFPGLGRAFLQIDDNNDAYTGNGLSDDARNCCHT